MPEIDFATEKKIFTTTAPEHNFATTATTWPTTTRRPTTSTTSAVTARDQTTSADEETDHRHPEVRRQQRARPLHTENIESDATEPRPRNSGKFRPKPDQFRATLKDFNNGHTSVRSFLFLLVVKSKRKHLSRPSRHQNFSTRVRTPVQQQTFLSSIVKHFYLVWFDLSKGGQIQVKIFFFHNNCNFRSFYPSRKHFHFGTSH